MRVKAGKRRKHRLADRCWHMAADTLLRGMECITTVAGQGFVAAIAAQCDSDRFAGQCTDTESGNGRYISEWFVINVWHACQKTEIVRIDRLLDMMCAVTL